MKNFTSLLLLLLACCVNTAWADDDVTTAKTSLKAALDTANNYFFPSSNSIPGYSYKGNTNADLSSWIKAAQEKYDSEEAIADEINALVKEFNNGFSINDVSGKYYRIKKRHTGGGMYIYANPAHVTSGTQETTSSETTGWNDRRIYIKEDVSTPQSLWKLEKTEDNRYNIKHVNSNQFYLGQPSNGSTLFMTNLVQWCGHYTPYAVTELESGSTTEYGDACRLYYSENNVYISADGSVTDGTANMVAWESSTNNNAIWQFVEVTSIPVAINSFGYATFCSPVALQISSNDGLKAYTAKVSDDKSVLKLTEISDGVIPAGEGVILSGTANATYNLDITTTSAELSDNDLTGTTCADATMTAGGYYGMSNSKGEGFYKISSSVTTFPANKAYLAATKLSTSESATALAFSFGESEPTGIGTVNTEQQSETYFDLQGRRVLYPVHGIFVTGHGKKVFIK